ncbi:C6 zinc finger domain-containing [Fusarium albosuccineum]|uniref:C6 zinc finger domain-containing n=1 Tax=Fusarium albosuccineum TaxID=1237068 RepID=A0A8H4LG53_9HYPO|nr:C6 zinc finger domain-containing [Fusarium albosuccineum]
MDGSDTPEEPSRPKQQRAYHKKVKTGCRTCKTRRIRCDEGKPACRRCVSTGRTCPGYETPESRTPKSQPGSLGIIPNAPKVLLPRKNPKEVRSYQYFLEVTGPALAGCFDAGFWCRELPRICVTDPALWHAVVALGSIHEAFGSWDPETKPGHFFALQQYNAAIQCLRESRSPRYTDGWRTVTASTIFTCICVIQGLYKQALKVHVTAGCKLLRELEAEEGAKHQQPLTRDAHDALSSTPIDIRPVKNLLLHFEMIASSLATGGRADKRILAGLNHCDTYGYWRFYKSPNITPQCPKHMLSSHMMRALRAVESLQNGFVIWWQDNRDDVTQLYSGSGVNKPYYDILLVRQAAYIRSYKELQKTIKKFKTQVSSSELAGFDMELSMLELGQATCYLFLMTDPEEPDVAVRTAKMPARYERLIELCEKLLESRQLLRSPTTGKLALSPDMLTMNPLFFAAQGSCSIATRKRAIELLRSRRLEGLWETALNASIAEAMWIRERELYEESQRAELGEDYVPPELEEDGKYGSVGLPIQFRVCSSQVEFTDTKNEAILNMVTWTDLKNGDPPARRVIHW